MYWPVYPVPLKYCKEEPTEPLPLKLTPLAIELKKKNLSNRGLLIPICEGSTVCIEITPPTTNIGKFTKDIQCLIRNAANGEYNEYLQKPST